MVGDPSAITATARSQEKPMLSDLQTGSAAGRDVADHGSRRDPIFSAIYSNTYWVLIQANNPIYYQYLLAFSSIIQYNT